MAEPERPPDIFLERAVDDGYAELTDDKNGGRITYVSAARTEHFGDPEEQVRAEYWAELIYRYGYPPDLIGIEVTVSDRTPRDVTVFKDDTLTEPFAVIECKRDGITDSEFNQAVEQAAGNGTWAKLRADYIGVVAGMTRRFLDFSPKYGVLEREANIIADLPAQYGRLDVGPVSRGAHHHCQMPPDAVGGRRLSPPAAFGELCKIIFVKVHDEKAKRRKGEPYQFQIKTYELNDWLGAHAAPAGTRGRDCIRALLSLRES